jgi:hypothetical protein
MRSLGRVLFAVGAVVCARLAIRTMTAPAKTTLDLLAEGWQWRRMAWSRHDEVRVFEWADAMNLLLDQLLEEQPALRYTDPL